MPDVDVRIEDSLIISALNTPGGAVFQWRDETAILIVNRAYARSPVNNPMNARHRGGGVGEFKRSWSWRRSGNQHRVRATVVNTAGHAAIVEFGRKQTATQETFAWTQHDPPGSTQTHERGTRGRPGNHVLRNATNNVMPRRADNYTRLA